METKWTINEGMSWDGLPATYSVNGPDCDFMFLKSRDEAQRICDDHNACAGMLDPAAAIKAMREALEKLKQYAVCNCPEDDSGRVSYHSNCHRGAMKIITEALATANQ